MILTSEQVARLYEVYTECGNHFPSEKLLREAKEFNSVSAGDYYLPNDGTAVRKCYVTFLDPNEHRLLFDPPKRNIVSHTAIINATVGDLYGTTDVVLPEGYKLKAVRKAKYDEEFIGLNRCKFNGPSQYIAIVIEKE